MMSRTPSRAMAKAGRAQNGCAMLVHASPYAIAMAALPISAPMALAAGITNGPCTSFGRVFEPAAQPRKNKKYGRKPQADDGAQQPAQVVARRAQHCV